MKSFFRFLFDVRVLSVLGVLALVAFVLLGADTMRVGLTWALVALGVVLLVAALVWGVRLWHARRAAKRLEQGMEADAAAAANAAASTKDKAAVEALRSRMGEAVQTIKTSKLGLMSGRAALYELPWYMIIGNPAAGKSTAIVKSGLTFPFADKAGQVIQGIGGTRNCDWFFTNEGILLDTAGRYSVHDEDRSEWLGFLQLLKKNRPLAPINGILIAASVAELASARPDAAIQLAKNLRQRVQELTETLEVFAPVYVVFTKADLISGFVEFFEDHDSAERDKVWGATLPYASESSSDAVNLFDKHFDELRDGLKQIALARMTLHRGQALPPGVLTFPLEFAAVKPALRSFLATLFEDNPFQFKPVFRGFYFTSALQEGSANSRASDQVARQFAMQGPAAHTTAAVSAPGGFFLRDLFSKVIFADKALVRQYASRRKLRVRAVVFGVAVFALAGALAAWSWSYLGNRQLMASVNADLQKAVRLQTDRIDLASRLQALEVLQQRIEELQRMRQDPPLGLRLGLYQGDEIERKLRTEYFAGVRQIMLQPVAQAIEGYLSEVGLNAETLAPMTRAPGAATATLASTAAAPAGAASGASTAASRAPVVAASRYTEASPNSTEEAYNALKTYLMLAERQRMEGAHMSDQIARFWRRWLDDNRGTMPRDQLMRSAERMIAFSMANLQDPAFPTINTNLGLVDQTREILRKVARGMPAKERVYAEIKARAATRFAPMTVARILTDNSRSGELVKEPALVGSYSISGAFTKEAWEGYVQDAIKDAATVELQRVDWVLNVSQRDDLSLEGSPEQIRAALTDLYKNEYVREWAKFMQGVTVVEFGSFDVAVQHLNILGDPTDSPLKYVLMTLFDQTAWDNPSLLNERLGRAQKGVIEWFKQSIMRMSPSKVEVGVDVTADGMRVPMGPIGREFAALPRIVMTRDTNPPLLNGYLQALSKVRSRFNTIKNEGDAGPGARAMMAGTLEAGGSEIAQALKFVDDQMLLGMTPAQRNALRPLLVRPLMQAYAVVVPQAETEINRRWDAEVFGPFQRLLAPKYPFDPASKVEAGAAEIAKIFGPEGAIAKFGNDTLGPLVVRRGDEVEARQWAELGIHLRPVFKESYGAWVAPLQGAAAGAAGGAAVAQQTAFQLLPMPAPGLLEYTIVIDGQTMRHRNAAAVWADFVWPNPSPQPGVRISGVTLDGRTVELFSAAGEQGAPRMWDAAKVRQMPDGLTELSWGEGDQAATVQMRIIRRPGEVRAGAASGDGFKGLKLPQLVAGQESATANTPAAPAGANPAQPQAQEGGR